MRLCANSTVLSLVLVANVNIILWISSAVVLCESYNMTFVVFLLFSLFFSYLVNCVL